ncbi:membrane protein insertase YidC [Brevibacterium album]|uniref:membrane protein insertase YidC n=1 Tax=Brevibacterium album TaxID=417948 RepID=UPI00040BBD51|nr:membrane protein insertase YidC [Brevibacterium album]
MGFFDTILYPIQWVVAWILALFHHLFTMLGMSADGGWTWVLSIVGLTVVVRAAVIPLFVRQIKSQRKMQMIQPEIQRLQKKYKGKKDQFSRQAMVEEQQALFKKHGTSPFASCLPLLVQMPIFLSLFRVIMNVPQVAEGHMDAVGGMTRDLAVSMDHAVVLGIPLSASFLDPGEGVNVLWVRILTAILIVIMAGMMFLTQRHMMTKNMSEAAMNNPFMQQQKMMLYLMPVVFGIGGVYFPLGVLIYWLISNGWTMGQQTVIIRNMPTPGSQAERELMERRARKGKSPLPGSDPIEMKSQGSEDTSTEGGTQGGQRSQPVSAKRQKQKRKKRRK